MAKKTTILGLDSQEFATLAKRAGQEAQAESHRLGLPVATEIDGQVILEHPDGRVEVVK